MLIKIFFKLKFDEDDTMSVTTTGTDYISNSVSQKSQISGTVEDSSAA